MSTDTSAIDLVKFILLVFFAGICPVVAVCMFVDYLLKKKERS